MAAGNIEFECEHCGRQLGTAAAAIGRRVTCPRCHRRTRVEVPDESPAPPPHRPVRPVSRFPWMWIAGAGAAVLLMTGIGVAFAAVMLGPARPDRPSTTTVEAATPKQDVPPLARTPGPPPDNTATAATPLPDMTVGMPSPPPKAADWKLTGPMVRKGPRVEGSFNQVLTAEEGFEMVEVFTDVDCPGSKRSEGFDFYGVTLAVRDSKAGSEPIRRAAIGFTLADDGPEKSSYFTPSNVSVAKAGDACEFSQQKTGLAVKIFARVTGDQTGPCRIAPKQNPTRLGFVFTVPKGSVPLELQVGDGTLALGTADTGTPGATTGTAKTTGDLPGARGKQFDKVGSLPAGIEFAAVYMTENPFGPAPKPLPQTFPSGTKTLDAVVALKRRPPNGTSVWREVRGKDGVVKLKGFVMMTSENNATGHFEIPLQCAPTSGSYPDGDYQTRILVNDKVVAVLNWSVGGAAKPVGPVGATKPVGTWNPVEVCRLDTAAAGVAFAPTGNLVTVSDRTAVTEWDLATARALRQVSLPSGNRLVAVTQDGRFGLAVRRTVENQLGDVVVWDLTRDGVEVGAWKEPIGAWEAATPHGALTSDGRLAAVLYKEPTIRTLPGGGLSFGGETKQDVYLWDTAGKSLREPFRSEWAVALSADGQWVVTSDKSKNVVIADTRTGDTIRKLAGAPSDPLAVYVAGNRRYVAATCAGDKPAVLVWDATTGELLHTLGELRTFARGLAFSPDGRTLVAAERGDDSKGVPPVLHRWEIATGKELGSLTVKSMTDVYTVAVSADGETLAAVGAAGKQAVVRVWKSSK